MRERNIFRLKPNRFRKFLGGIKDGDIDGRVHET
jgi:hypothetical protein